ncbi:hypothetical protein NLG97_g3915 [Lecanicillium saksenae]|uniref:Uncharacterized protein n=1 Tax=Lecanicillium saksenae TaxID=468837 RepID=A0ACC1QWS0_9HYPO|nr:hypothetical protein NLG97_g3915 [Lecanicillium saksenae]
MDASADSEFGPARSDKFDFTLLFELIMLSLVPASVIILTMPFYVKNMASASNQVRPGLLLWAKLATGVALVAVQLAGLILWQRAGLYRSALAIGASVLSFLASLCVVALLYMTHTFSLRSSSFLAIFLSLTMLFDITMTRSYFLRGTLDALGALQAAVASLKLVLVVLEEMPKRRLFRSDMFRPGPGEVAGFWGRALLVWVNPILQLGWGQSLTIEDLPDIGERYDSEQLFDQFVPYWQKVLIKEATETSKQPLAWALVSTLFWQFIIPILPRLCFVGFSFSRPFFLEQAVKFVGAASSTTEASRESAYGLIGAAVLIFGGLMRLSTVELEKSAAVTLMTADVTGVQDGLSYIHDTWSAVIELGLGLFALYTFVGYACFLLFIPSSIAAIGTYVVTKKMAHARTVWNAKTENRVAATSNVLAQLKSIKAMGLTEAMSAMLQEKRLDEIETSMIERNARVMIFGIYGFGAAMAPVAVLAGARFWTRASNPMTIPETFAAYAAIFIAVLPLNSLLGHLPFYASGYACLMRIQKFLMLPEVRDTRDCDESEKHEAEGSEKRTALTPSRGYAVELENVSVTSDLSGPILNNVSLRVPRGSLAMLHGTVGCGKSAFLQTLMGELAINAGTIKLSTKRIAYVSQSPWILNTTIRAHVVGPHEYVEELYNDVLFACALDRDIHDLPNGDQTLTGSNGCNLSGGQKQRLGLARALFARASLILLDNFLSSLDTTTADMVFKRVCGREGLLRRWNSTIIMTTNQHEVLRQADFVFEMNQQGRISVTKAGNRLDAKHKDAQNPLDVTPAPETPTPAIVEKSEPPSVDIHKATVDSNELDRSRRTGDWRLYGYFFQSISWLLVGFYLVTTAVAATMERMPQIFMRIWLTTDAANDNYFIGFALLSFGEIFITCVAGVQFFKQIVPKSSAELHWRLLQSVLESTLSFISHTDAGSLLNHLSQDISIISQRMPVMMAAAISMGFNLLVDIGIIASGAKFTPPIVIFLCVVLYGIQYFYLRTSRQMRYLELETAAPLVTHFTETSSGMAHIRGLSCQQHFKTELFLRLNRSQKPFYWLLCVQQWLTLMLDFTSFVSAVILITVTTLYPSSSSDSAIGLALLNLISFSSTASYFLQTWVHAEISLGGLSRIQSFCNDTPQEKDCTDTGPLSVAWPSTGKIEFNCVTAKYMGPDGESREALKNTTVSIRQGDKVGISGRTGSGKTSMMLALLNLMEFSGSITIAGRNIKTVPRHILRSRITTMTQDGVELKGTLRMNVFPFTVTPPPDNEIIGTLEHVGIWDQVSRNGGLEADITKVGLSHGQKQLLFLTRAMLHQQTMETKIILVDEATSDLDADTDERVQELMAEAFADCTVITIAHQRDYSASIDLAIELDSGHVVKLHRRSTRTGKWVESE